MTQYKNKFDSNGAYQPFYGYTALSFLGKNSKTISKEIEGFISTSSLKNYYSVLPSLTFHTTLFNIYCMAAEPIPPVKRWMEKEEKEIPKNFWLPEYVLKIQHTMASSSLRKLPKELKIKMVEFYYKNSLGVWVELENRNEINDFRGDLANIYEHKDFLRFHMFAYKYKVLPTHVPKELKDDLYTLNNMTKSLVGASLVRHNIYLYDSMTNFIPIDVFYPEVSEL